MTKNLVCILFSGLIISSALVSCGDKEVPPPTSSADRVVPITQTEAKIRDETISDLLSIKNEVRMAIDENINADYYDSFITDLKSLRPRLEYIHMRTAHLSTKEQMVVRGNLAVITNQLKKDLLTILAKAPGNDELAVEIAHLQEQLSPIPLASRHYTSTN